MVWKSIQQGLSRNQLLDSRNFEFLMLWWLTYKIDLGGDLLLLWISWDWSSPEYQHPIDQANLWSHNQIYLKISFEFSIHLCHYFRGKSGIDQGKAISRRSPLILASCQKKRGLDTKIIEEASQVFEGWLSQVRNFPRLEKEMFSKDIAWLTI